jgi:peroxiredoxin
MRNKYRILSAFVLIITLFALIIACSKDVASPKVGSVAPDFVIKDASGKSLQLSDLRGTVILLNFWATWCPPCQQEVPSLSRLNAAMSGKGFRMITVSIDEGGSAAVESFFRVTGYRLPTLLDSDGKIGKMYGITGVPETFVIDRQGVIRKKVVGPFSWDDPSMISYLSELQKR